MSKSKLSLIDFQVQASNAARIMKSLGNEKRLMILCKLIELGEMSVIPMAESVGLSQSALSQHLARMRDEQLVEFRREGQTLFYRVSDPNVNRIINTLQSIFC